MRRIYYTFAASYLFRCALPAGVRYVETIYNIIRCNKYIGCGLLHSDTKLIKMIKLLLLSLLIIAIAFALLSIKLLLKRNGKFSSQHVHDNPGLRKLGIHCVMDQDREARDKNGAY